MRRHIPLVFLVLALGISVFLRMKPAFLPVTKDMARASVFSDIAKDINKEVEEKLKDLPWTSRIRAEGNLFNARLKNEHKSIEVAIGNKQKEFKSYWQDDSGQTFLLELDPYHWLRLVRDIGIGAHQPNSSIAKTGYDNFMLAPVGMKADVSLHRNLHVYLAGFIFKIVGLFDKKFTLVSFVFYVPVAISCISLLLIFFFCMTIEPKNGALAGSFAAVILGLTPIFLQRSLAGWFDTDPYVVLLSLLSVWTFYLSFKNSTRRLKSLLFALIGGLSIGLFSFTWDGWWYIFDLIVFSALFYILNFSMIKENTGKRTGIIAGLISLSSFILFSLIFVGIFCGPAAVGRFISEPLKLVFTKDYLQNQFWPNTFFTVGELSEASMNTIVSGIGGMIPVLIGIFYLLVVVYNRQTKEELERQFIGFLFFFWIAVIMYVATKALRFSLLLAIPYAVSIGLFLANITDFLERKLKRFINIPGSGSYIRIIFSVLFFALLVKGFSLRAFAVSDVVPLLNDNWQNVLNKIEKETPPSAIINSWWDYGHWFKGIAGRRVIFDGATQNTPMSYWMGKVFLTNSETEAYGILRMINSGSNKAFEELERLGVEKLKCLDVLNKIILLKKADADTLLCGYIGDKEGRDKILSYTHNPRAVYFVVEPSLISKMSAISFLGGWDFKRADIYNKFIRLKKEDFTDYLLRGHNYDKKGAVDLYSKLTFLNNKDALGWISPTYKYYEESADYRQEKGSLFFSNGFVVNTASYQVYFYNALKKKWGVPKSIFYVESGALKELNFKNSDMDISVLLLIEGDKYRIITLDPNLARSMFTRLYYLNGLGLKYFKPFIKEGYKDSPGHIIVYKVEWDNGV